MGSECEFCGSSALEFRKRDLSTLCLFCFDHVPIPRTVATFMPWRVAANVVNYLERRFVGLVKRAVDDVLEERGQ